LKDFKIDETLYAQHENEYEQLYIERDKLQIELSELAHSYLELEKKLQIAIKGLEFYGEKENWYSQLEYSWMVVIANEKDYEVVDENAGCEGQYVGGFVARQALEKIKEKK
jgi:hypothetical protein